jgi:hypothetical protein
MIPTEIPERLRSIAILPEFAREGEVAWTREAALDVLDSLEWTKVAVVGAQGLGEMGGVLVPTKQTWAFHEAPGETETTRARRSRDAAAHFIEGLSGVVPYVLLEFSYQDDAA